MSDSSAAAEEAAPSPIKRKRKRRKAPAVDASRGDVPAFARAFPKSDELTALLVAFEAGRYAAVREGVARLLKETDDEEIRRAARELRARMSPDPIAVYLLLAAIALLSFLSFWYWTHGHSPV